MKKILCAVLTAASAMLCFACADTDNDGGHNSTAYRSAFSFVYMFNEQDERVAIYGRESVGPDRGKVAYGDCTLNVGEKYSFHVIYAPGHGANHPIVEYDAGVFCDVTMEYDEEYFRITENTERGVSWYDLECLKTGKDIRLSIHSEVTKNIDAAASDWYVYPTRVIFADIVE